MQPSASPWLSPKVVTTNDLPKLLPDTCLFLNQFKVITGQQEHARPALLEFEPDERQFRVGSFERCLAIANLTDEYSIVCQKSRGILQNPVHALEAVVACRETEFRLVAKLGGTRLHVVSIHVGRVAYDEVVTLVAEPVEKVRAHEPHAVLEAVLAHVDRRDGKRIVGNVDCIYVRFWKGIRRSDRYAAAAGAQVGGAANAAGLYPRREFGGDQFGKRRARHEHALVDVEAQPAEPGLV